MSTFTQLYDVINDNINVENNIKNESINLNIPERGTPFDLTLFNKEVYDFSDSKNRAYAELKQNISAYDVSQTCMMSIIKKLNNTPVESYATKWLPVIMRGVIGSAIHDFIQSHSSQFTEIEASLKIPSIRFSGRLDALIGSNILVEIKSCTYDDYNTIIKTNKPRIADFYQTVCYKYILENYLEEARSQELKNSNNPNGVRTSPPKLSKYNIDTIQFIYIANNIVSDDIEDLGQCLDNVKKIKKMLNSKKDPFYFLTCLTLDLSTFDNDPYITFVKNKIDRIKYYLDNNKLPTIDDEFVDIKKCFFCLYNKSCQLKK